MAWVPALDDMAWKRASTGRGSMPPQITSFEPHARPPNSFRKPRQGNLILFSQISSIRNEGRHEGPTLYLTGMREFRSNDFPTETLAYNADAQNDVTVTSNAGLATYFVNVRNSICCNSTTDVMSSSQTGSEFVASAQGQQNIASVILAAAQPERNPGGILNPKDYGASCNAIHASATFVTANRGVSTTQGSNVIRSIGFLFQPGTATQDGGGGDVGKVISMFGHTVHDLGPTSYIALVSADGQSATLAPGWAASATDSDAYVIYSGYPSNPNDPSTAHDDTVGIHNCSVAASVLNASGNYALSATGGAKCVLPPDCSFHNLVIANNSSVEGNDGGSTYGSELQNNPNSEVSPEYVQANGFADDPIMGINMGASPNAAIRNFTIKSVTFPFLNATGESLACVAQENQGSLFSEEFLTEHITYNLCPIGKGSPFGWNQATTGVGSVTGNVLTVTSITSSNFGGSSTYHAGGSGDWLIPGHSITIVGLPSTTTIVSALGPYVSGGTGTYALSATTTDTGTSHSFTSPAVLVNFGGQSRFDQYSNNAIGMNGDLSDYSDFGSTWTANFQIGAYIGPTEGAAGNCAWQLSSRRFEENGVGIILDSACRGEMNGIYFQYQSGAAIQSINATANVIMHGGALDGNGGRGDGGNPNNAQIQVGGTTSHFVLEDVEATSVCFSSACSSSPAKYLLETMTGYTPAGSLIGIDGGDVSAGYTVALTHFAPGGIPSKYWQNTTGEAVINTTQPITVAGALTLTSSSGGAANFTAISSTTTGPVTNPTITISGLKPVNNLYDCSGVDLTTNLSMPMILGTTTTTASALAITSTVTSGDTIRIKCGGGN